MPLDISEIAVKAGQFARQLEVVKRSLPARDFDWYPYDSLSVFSHLNALLTGANRALIGSHTGGSVLDIGCGDGAVGLFLESLGYHVVCVDHPVFNHNGMRGVRALKQALGSSIEIREMDLDRNFDLPAGKNDITFLLGTIYHLQNPLQVLEAVAMRSSYCFASTRVARKFPGGKAIPDDLAVAYLLEEKELNDDDSNYFIFSHGGLRVALRRTHWDVLDYLSVGDKLNSDPVSLKHDERVYCLLKSRYGLASLELLEGWHEAEGSGWRWTKRKFAVRIPASSGRSKTLKAVGFVPPELLRGGRTIKLGVECNGSKMKEVMIRRDGNFDYIASLNPAAGEDLLLRFELSEALPPDASDSRERGIIVASITVS